MKTKALWIVIVIALAAVAAMLVVRAQSSPGAGSSGYEGQVIEPAAFAASDYAGKPLVINFFGSWCEFCKLEAQDLGRFAAQNPGAQVVGIASQDTKQSAESFMAEYGLTFPLVVDDGNLTAKYGISGWPTTIFFDPSGKETDRLVGASTFDQFTASLAQAQ